MKRIAILGLAGLLLLLGLFAWRLSRPADNAIPSALIGQPVPPLALKPIVPGHPGLTDHDLRSGQPHLVNVFASWCLPCRTEVPLLIQLQAEGAIVDGIAIRDTAPDLARFLAEVGDPYRAIGDDPDSTTQIALGSAGVPESFVVDGTGLIRYQRLGPIGPHDMAAVRAALGLGR